ncbi:tripartite tricarboxylate transporter substrate binding protein [Cupriavidus taiwanensis]|uniref:Bug family tripartite tricarboxylate transporter substrate binding protein n=1 Tax=Cupriavidus taiwanensis TaxID=164546 RepID=UPI002541F1FC|nr:tripartite tricarboxylate transporter substrate binding protein [Cupriavidus taiwanensis]MDK3022650.1 tripartite tricarboxylate transporter substrate binding protein [Cupriavidus taiwanensis]
MKHHSTAPLDRAVQKRQKHEPTRRAWLLRHGSAIAGACVLAALVGASQSTLAQDGYPSKPVTIVVGFPPGTATDTVSRVLAERLSQRLGQQFIVDNRPGAGGSIAAGIGARAKPDGYTLLVVGAASQAINPHLYNKLTYDAKKDFAPIGQLAWLPYLFVVNKDNPAKDLRQFLAQAKKSPNSVTYASTGVGTGAHLVMSVLLAKAGVQMVHVPYKGSGQAQTDLLGGQVMCSFDTMVSELAMVKSGKLKALAISTPRRSEIFPDVPTVAEQGFPGFDLGVWLGLIGPAGLPAEIQNRLAKEVNLILAEPETRTKLIQLGTEVRGTSSPQEFGKIIRTDYEYWGKVVRDFNVKAD